MKSGKKYLGFAVLFSAICSIVVGSCVTFAAYMAAVSVEQSTGYLGKFNQDSIFLNANIWEVDEPAYFMYRWSSSHAVLEAGKYIAPSKTITPTIGGTNFTLYVFEYDKNLEDSTGNTCDKYLFFRLKRQSTGKGFSTTASTDYRIHNNKTDTYINLYGDEKDSNHYIARHVTLTASDYIKVETTGESITHYGNNNADVYPGNGTWTIDFYISVNNNIHIYCTNEDHLSNFKWNQTQDITYSASCNYWSIDDWHNGDIYNNSKANSARLALNSDDQLYFVEP